MLLKAGADIEVGNNRCSTPLMEAAQEGHLDLVRRLLQQGANVNAATANGDTALHHAAENGHAEVCRELLNWGAPLDLPVNLEDYKTPLMKAARAGHLEVVQLLVKCGAPVDQTTAQNEATALSLACNGGHAQVCCCFDACSGPPSKLASHSFIWYIAVKAPTTCASTSQLVQEAFSIPTGIGWGGIIFIVFNAYHFLLDGALGAPYPMAGGVRAGTRTWDAV